MAREVLAKAQRALAANPVQPRATTAIRPKRPSSMPGLRTSKFKAFVAQFEVWVIGAVTLVCSAAMVTQMVAC